MVNYYFFLQYKDKIKRFSSSIHTVFGTAIHEVIQHYLDVMYETSGAEADRIDLEDRMYHLKEDLEEKFEELNK